MLNHARTLLANLPVGAVPDISRAGDELAAPNYTPVELPAGLLSVRAQLFGADPDRDMINYRCAQLLAVLHGSALERYVAALDARLTYRFDDPDLVSPEFTKPQITQISRLAGVSLTVIGTPAPPDASGRMSHKFRLTGQTTTRVQVERQTPPVQKTYLSFSMSAGLSSAVELPGSGYSALLATDDPAQDWLIEVRNRPQRDLAALADGLAHVGEPALLTLFGTGAAEPYATFRNLWYGRYALPQRLGALILALIYRTEERRTSG